MRTCIYWQNIAYADGLLRCWSDSDKNSYSFGELTLYSIQEKHHFVETIPILKQAVLIPLFVAYGTL